MASYTDIHYNGNPISIPWPTYSVIPADCFGLEDLQFRDAANADLVANGVVVIDWVAKTITYQNPTGDAFITMYAVFNAPTSYTDSGTTITFKDFCLETTISLPFTTLANMSATITQAAATQQFGLATDSYSTSKGIPNSCGPFEYSIVEAYSFVSISTASNPGTISVQSNLMADINTYTATFQVKLTNYPEVAPVQVAFQIQLVDPCLTTVLALPTTLTAASIVSMSGIGNN